MPFYEIRRVAYSYPGKKYPALTGIDLRFEKEGITAIIGPNGSGKTTLSRLMIGILRPDEGDIYLDGHLITEYNLAEIGRRVGYVFQNPDLQLFCSTVAGELTFGMAASGLEKEKIKEKLDYYLDYFELHSRRDAFPMHLSRGERQRLAIAAVLVNEPDFLILDEPTSGLDARRRKMLAEHLRKIESSGTGILLLSHDLVFVKSIAGRIVSMKDGRVEEVREWGKTTAHGL